MFKTLKKRIGVIGCGNMGSAIIERIKPKFRVVVFDKDKNKIRDLSGVQLAEGILDLVGKTDVIILAVKPQDFEFVLNEIKGCVKNRLVISIAAGIKTGDIEKILKDVRVIRVMPNIGAIVGRSVSYICKGKFAKREDLNLSLKLFKSIGSTFTLSEDLMNAATAVGGSGPGFWGYLFDSKPMNEWNEYKTNYFIPELTSAARSVGFDEKAASLMASSVTTASIQITEALHIRPAELTKRVASKGGTTEAGLEVLQQGGSLTEAVKAAKKRAEELSNED